MSEIHMIALRKWLVMLAIGGAAIMVIGSLPAAMWLGGLLFGRAFGVLSGFIAWAALMALAGAYISASVEIDAQDSTENQVENTR